MNEYIQHMENGLLVKDYENPQSIAEVIKTVCNNDQLREYLKKNSRKSVRKFAKSKIDKLEVNYYKRILKMNQNCEFNLPFWEKIFRRK
jgi:glycosyltransferase involved in cell wall biosynthesis